MFTKRIMVGSALTAFGVCVSFQLVRTWGRVKAATSSRPLVQTVGKAVAGL